IVQNSTTITAVTPAAEPGVAAINVSSGGQSMLLTGSFFFNPPAPPSPTITSLSVFSGALGGTLSIFGTNFTNPMPVAFRAGSWSLSGNTASSVSVAPVSSTQIDVVIPNRAMTGPIQVSNPFGAAATCDIFTVTSPGPPTISSFDLASGGAGTPNQ